MSWLVGVPFAAIVLLFALSNRQSVILALWPFEDGLAVPVFFTVLAPLLLGFVIGAAVAGGAGLKHRRAARRNAKRADALERQLQGLAAGTAGSSPLPALPASTPKAGST
ncbi:lipopolysaccharide assembly protein LapA domain-containing protein [Telmatospirillum sp.]|uniref:lipopolysaccharide assembly protein LapA domain-containing protein n=1 Tax=Telmatospirillum sp. TaxID=2079197 RepID=UPI00283C61B8|nr:lipopolysaccharide assembly protein LapA domain-containing protein [Telmatospirillum sp.]MDR3440353.1 lipopolysaccharide assembly protein LapA domain-containing protein [Telmatospirillum sp.]